MSGKKIKEALKEIVGVNTNLPIQAVVTAVNGDHCAIKLASGLEIDDVRLKASIDGSQDFILVNPKKNTKVIVLPINGTLEDLLLIKIDQIENIEIKQNGLEILIDNADKKVRIKNDHASLYELFDLLVSAIKQLKVFTPVGPSGAPLPDTMARLEEIEMKFKKILK